MSDTVALQPNQQSVQVEQKPATLPQATEPPATLPPAQPIAIRTDSHSDQVQKATWSTSYVNSLPNSSFLYIEAGADTDGEGKTVPRSKRHFPYKDASGKIDLPHLRNAIARIPQSNAPGLTPEKKRSLQERARKLLENANKDMGEMDEGMMQMYPLYGATSFVELEELQAVEQSSMIIAELTSHFQMMASNIMQDMEIIDKTAAIKRLADEFTARVDLASNKKKDEEPSLSIIEKMVNLVKPKATKVAKWEGGEQYESGDYAYTPDARNPSTWKLRLSDSPGRITFTSLKRAAERLSSAGLRGQALGAVKRRIRKEYERLGYSPDRMPDSVKANFMVWKSATGQYRWFAIYSNNFRDKDNPPEIISEKSHRNYVEMVKSGTVDYPELWHWHLPGTAWGKADMVDYTDDGFAIAGGYVYEGHEKEAEAVAGMDDIRMSHGMPTAYIMRNKADPTIIDFHVTREISTLPGWAAANPLTDFVMLSEV